LTQSGESVLLWEETANSEWNRSVVIRNRVEELVLINDNVLFVGAHGRGRVHSLNVHDGSVSHNCTFDSFREQGLYSPKIVSGSYICGGERLIISARSYPHTDTEIHICSTNDSTMKRIYRTKGRWTVHATDRLDTFILFGDLRGRNNGRVDVLKPDKYGGLIRCSSFLVTGCHAYMTASSTHVVVRGRNAIFVQVKIFNVRTGQLERLISYPDEYRNHQPCSVISQLRQELLMAVDGAVFAYCL